MEVSNNNPIGCQTVMDLAAKTSTSMIFAWDTTGVEPSTYYVRAMADSSNVIAEVDEENNNCTSFEAVTVYSPGQMGKLFVDKVETAVISGEDPPVVGFSTVYEFTMIVTNVGGSDVSGVVVNETISSDVTFVSVGMPSQGCIIAVPPPKIVWDVGTLAPGADATLTFRVSVTPACAGLLYLNHKEDVVASGTDTLLGGTVMDSGDTDVTVTAIIRDVAAVGQVPSSTIVCQGDTVAIEVTVKNFGDVSESFDVACYYDENLIGVLRVCNLEAGGQTTISFAWDTTGIAPGTYSIKAEADSSGEIAESDETNNVCLSPSAVKIVIHDVAIVSQVPSPTEVVQGGTVTIEVVVKNEGTEPENFSVSCYYNDTLLETKAVTDLEPNTTLTVSFVWDTAGVPAGKYFINTVASTVPGEKDTDDNACLSTTSVTVILPQYSLTITTTAGGTTDPVPGTYTYVSGASVEVTAIPDAYYTFDHWELDGIDVGSANPYSVLTDADHTLHAVFVYSPLSVSISPTAAKIKIGESVAFTSTVAGGVPDYSYQWYLNDGAVPDATFASWTFVPESTGSYVVYLFVTDSLGNTAKSNDASVNVAPQLTVSISPMSASIVVGESVEFTSTVSGGYTPYGYQWYLHDNLVSGATSASWTFTPTSEGNYYIYLKVTDAEGNVVQSEKAKVTVIPVSVGGYSVSLSRNVPTLGLINYTLVIALFGVALSLLRRRRK